MTEYGHPGRLGNYRLPPDQLDRQPLGSGMQPMNYWFPPDPSSRTARESDSFWSTDTQLTNSVTHLHLEVETIKLVQSKSVTPPKVGPPTQVKPVAFTSKKVPRFRQVFNAIVWSNG